MMVMRLAIYIFFVLLPVIGGSQELVGLHAVWDDDLNEWRIYSYQDSTLTEGTLEPVFSLDRDPDDWSYRLGEATGRIKRQFAGGVDQWVLDGDAGRVIMRQVWPRDPSEWSIAAGDVRFVIKTRFRNAADEWHVDTRDDSPFYMYTAYEGDNRDWVIEDYFDKQVALEVKMALVFVVMYNSTR